MGQIVFAPPNVKGWDGGKSWITTSTLLFRYNFANYLVNGDAMLPKQAVGKGAGPEFRKAAQISAQIQRPPIDPAKLIPAELRDKPSELVDFLSTRLFATRAPENEHQAFVRYVEARKPDTSDTTLRGLIHLMMSTPQFQLT
jgi:hypothetical protein